MQEVETSKIVDPVDVVGVGMGKEDRVDCGNLLTDHLVAKVCAGVDKDIFARVGADDER